MRMWNLTSFELEIFGIKINVVAASQSMMSGLVNGNRSKDIFTPIKVLSVRSKASNWQTSNIGLYLGDINLNNVDLLWLILDYFSSYQSINILFFRRYIGSIVGIVFRFRYCIVFDNLL